MTREQINGPREIQQGFIMPTHYTTFDEAKKVANRWNVTVQKLAGEWFYEVTGVEGDYRIIQRDVEPTPSRYISEK